MCIRDSTPAAPPDKNSGSATDGNTLVSPTHAKCTCLESLEGILTTYLVPTKLPTIPIYTPCDPFDNNLGHRKSGPEFENTYFTFFQIKKTGLFTFF